MATLLELREQLDKIDKQLVELYEQRMAISEQVAYIKIESGKPVFDKQREEEKLASVSAMCTKDENKKVVCDLFEELMRVSKEVQYQIIAKEGKEK